MTKHPLSRLFAPALLGAALLLPPTLAAQAGAGQEQKLVDRFDANEDGYLDAVERAEARGVAGGRNFGGGIRSGRNVLTGSRGNTVTPQEVRNYPESTVLYDTNALRTVFITFENADWEEELATFYGSDVDVPATVMVDGKSYRDVGVHFRGNSSYRMVPQGSKHSLNLSFDLVHDGQGVGGYRTLNLLNALNDPALVRTVLFSEIARHYVAAPKVNYLRVVINGELWGIYVNVQQYNKDMVREFFTASGEGARWKVPGSPRGRGGLEYLGEDPVAYRNAYEIKTKDSDESWRDLINLTRVLNQTPPERLEAALAPILDVDGVLKFLALDNALANSDGYWTRASDYSIYQDEKGRFHIFPGDMNEALGVQESSQLDPLVGLNDDSKPLRARLLAVAALRERYLGYVRDIAEKHMDWTMVEPRVRELQALIDPDIKVDTRKLYTYDTFQSDLGRLAAFFQQRREFLLR